MKDVETLINKDIEQGNYHLILEGFTYDDSIDEEKKAILVVVIMDLLYLFIIIILFKLWL